MKEDVLEQVVEDYLQSRGYFTRHNLRFRPSASHDDYVSNKDSVRSDVDVVGLHPTIQGASRVWVVSCKAWQTGFDADAKLRELRGEKKNAKRETWMHFRELWVPKWSEAFRAALHEATGEASFRYSVAVTRLTGKVDQEQAERAWISDPTIVSHLAGCEFSFLTMKQMWSDLQQEMTTTPASSQIGRLAQLLKAAKVEA